MRPDPRSFDTTEALADFRRGIWKAFSLKPHLSETFTLSKDPLFVEKVRDVVGLYLDPPERAVVLSRRREVPGSGPVPSRCWAMMPGMPE